MEPLPTLKRNVDEGHPGNGNGSEITKPLGRSVKICDKYMFINEVKSDRAGVQHGQSPTLLP